MKGRREGGREGGTTVPHITNKSRREGGREGGRTYLDVVGVRVWVALNKVISHPLQAVEDILQLAGILPGAVKLMHAPSEGSSTV